MTIAEASFTLNPVPNLDRYLRLGQALEALRIPQAVLAREASVREAAISTGVRHQEGLESHWPAIAEALYQHGIDERWLLYGRGEMRVTDTPSTAVAALTLAGSSDGLREVGTVTAQASYSESMIPRLKSMPGETAVLVQDSAMEPLIRAGQWVVLATYPRTPRDGEIVLLRTKGGEAWVRRYRVQDAFVILEHINPDRQFRTVMVRKEDVDSVRVVVGVFFE